MCIRDRNSFTFRSSELSGPFNVAFNFDLVVDGQTMNLNFTPAAGTLTALQTALQMAITSGLAAAGIGTDVSITLGQV